MTRQQQIYQGKHATLIVWEMDVHSIFLHIQFHFMWRGSPLYVARKSTLCGKEIHFMWHGHPLYAARKVHVMWWLWCPFYVVAGTSPFSGPDRSPFGGRQSPCPRGGVLLYWIWFTFLRLFLYYVNLWPLYFFTFWCVFSSTYPLSTQIKP